MRWLAGALLALLAAPAAAQPDDMLPLEPETPAEPAAGVALPPSVTRIPETRPTRFVMLGGNVVVGRRVGEDPEFFWIVVTDSGELARVRKVEVGSMDYRVDEPAPDVAPARSSAPELPPPLEVGPGDVQPPRRRGRGLVIGGGVLFGIFYLGSVLYAPNAEGPGALLAIPVFGPVFYGAARELDGDQMAVMVVASLLQAGGAVMLYFGIRQMSEAPDDDLSRGAGLSIAAGPALLPGGFGVASGGSF